MRSILLLATLLAMMGPASGAERRVILHLASGAEVTGVVGDDGFDEGVGITLTRDDNGGLLSLRWDQIRPADVTNIKRMYGYLGDEMPPIQLEALKVTTSTGTLIGLDEGRKDGALLLRRGDVVTPIPLESIIRPPETVLVDALELENPANVFERKKLEAPPKSPVEWYNLALIAESLTLFEQARNCFETCLELDPNFSKKTVIERKVATLSVKEKELEETMALRTIRSLKYRGAYREALALVDEFGEKWPSSAQLSEVQNEKADIGRAQRKAVLGSIQADFNSYLRRAAEEVARNQEIGLGEAMTWATEQAYPDVRVKLAKLYGTPEENIDELWNSRGKSGSPIQYSYGGGTFVLGDKAKEGFGRKSQKEEEAEEQKKKAEDKPKTLEEKIQEKLKEKAEGRAKKQKEQKEIGNIVDVPPSEEEWWKLALPKERLGFLIACFAETSGKVDVLTLRMRDCTTCYGKGKFEFFARGANPDQNGGDVPCPRCKTLTFDRIVVFR
ncbi:MAG: tetratricopeptide repeat protein [Planctomycetota bacterium]